MATRKKRALPPWLQGVTIKKVEKKAPFSPTAEESLNKQQGKEVIGKLDAAPLMKVNGPGKEEQALEVKSQETILETKKGQKNDITGEHISKSNSDEDEEKWSVEKAVEMSYKEFSFEGTITYSHNMNDCNLLCDEIMSNIDANSDTVIGFDTEWPVTYEKGKQGKTSLVQLCLSTDKCYLFHVSCMPKFPVMLKKLLESHHVKKVGLNIENDFWKLDTDFDLKAKDVIQKSVIELRSLGNKKLRSAENWSLEGLAKNVLQIRISKDPSVRKCDWRQFPLPVRQQRYAATDAVTSLMLYQKLTSQ